MCDPYSYISTAWQSNFYQQYMQQHAAMTQWMQQVHQYVSPNRPHPYHCSCGVSRPEHSHGRHCRIESVASTHSSRHETRKLSSSSSSESDDSNGDQSEASTDDDESELEYELNVDAILAMRAAKEDLKKESSSSEGSFAIVDDVPEEYEFIELGSLRHYGYSKLKLVGQTNANKEFALDKQIMDQIYGEKSSTIAGLETAMSINFETLYDKHQPPLWPVLPVCLN